MAMGEDSCPLLDMFQISEPVEALKACKNQDDTYTTPSTTAGEEDTGPYVFELHKTAGVVDGPVLFV
jgi:hypothetical protein